MGSTGSGMSNFINKLTGMQENSDAKGLESCTRHVVAYPYNLDNKRFIFVDTPGWNSQYYSSSEMVMEIVSRWLKHRCEPRVQVAGIIYTHRITDGSISRTEQNCFQTFAKWCGGETARWVQLVTTMWGDLDTESEGQAMENTLNAIYWGTLLREGAGYRRFNNTQKGAWAIIRPLAEQQRDPLLRKRLMRHPSR
ncbi:hypothetical protein ID866_6424 [Astraeus odoratus]|nr:hypothetical protein ID866_6424 [Astraeus odoratus]